MFTATHLLLLPCPCDSDSDFLDWNWKFLKQNYTYNFHIAWLYARNSTCIAYVHVKCDDRPSCEKTLFSRIHTFIPTCVGALTQVQFQVLEESKRSNFDIRPILFPYIPQYEHSISIYYLAFVNILSHSLQPLANNTYDSQGEKRFPEFTYAYIRASFILLRLIWYTCVCFRKRKSK